MFSYWRGSHLGYAGEDDQAKSGTVESMLICKNTNILNRLKGEKKQIIIDTK